MNVSHKEKCLSTLTPLQELIGTKLITSKGEEIDTATLATKKQVILYFSAHWCPPCGGFTPKLSEAYEEYKNNSFDGAETEVIFVSLDSDAASFAEYHGEMSFPATLYEACLGEKLSEKFGVEGIPSMVAISPEGETIHKDESIDMCALIAEHGAAAFPLTPERVLELQSEAEARSAKSLKQLYDGTVPFVVTTEEVKKEPVSFADILQNEHISHIGLLLGDGDVSDASYQRVQDIIKQINADKSNCFKVIYMGWSLFNESSDHAKVADKFDYSLNDVSGDLRTALKNIIGGEVMAPTLINLRRGTGLCSVSGECEEEGVPVVVSLDSALRLVMTTGAATSPWDDSAIAAFEDAKKNRIEKLKANVADLKFLKASEGEGNVLIKNGAAPDMNDLLALGEDGVVGLYFSAHWCPPCRRFTPILVKCYEELKAAGKKFEVVFISSDNDKDEFESYFSSMVTSGGDQFLALDYEKRELKSDLSKIFDVSGIPTLVLLKPDGSIISTDGTEAVECGANYFPWDAVSLEKAAKDAEEAATRALSDALQKEKEDEEMQRASGRAVVKRICGDPASIQHNVSGKTLTFKSFSTAGAPDLLADSGVLYYEIKIVNDDGIPQLGFALRDSITASNEYAEEGVGDNDASWALDGSRGAKWHDGYAEWPCSWGAGNVIGLAANMDTGMIAVAKDGDWLLDGLGVVFRSDSIKAGVFPCITAADYEVRYSFNKEEFKYGPPPVSVWEVPELN